MASELLREMYAYARRKELPRSLAAIVAVVVVIEDAIPRPLQPDPEDRVLKNDPFPGVLAVASLVVFIGVVELYQMLRRAWPFAEAANADNSKGTDD
jgi:hypothetical protein